MACVERSLGLGALLVVDGKWFGQPIATYTRYVDTAGYAAAAALVLILGLVFWNRMLRRRVLQRTAALAESEQRFRQIAENIHEVFWLIASDSGKRLYTSPAYETVWGRPRESLDHDPRSFLEAIHPEDRPRVVEAMEADRTRGFEIEYRVIRPDASIRWVRDRGFPIQDEDSRIYRLAGIAEDITDRKLAEEVFRQADGRIRLIIDTIPTSVWCLRADGILDFVNQRWIDYTGVSLEEAMKAQNASVHPDDLPRVLERWLADKAAGRPSEDEMRLRRADGEYRWFLVRTLPLHDERGNISHWYGTSTDIEDYKRAEEKLRRSESQLAEAQRLAHTGSWEWDLRKDTKTWSDECYRIFGTQPGGWDLRELARLLIHPDDQARVFAALEHAIRDGQSYDMEYRILRRDGAERILHSLADVVCDKHGSPLRAHGTTQDVTELRRAEDELRTTTDQLRALSARLQSAREEEGIRIAREIHDELGAALTSLRWDLEAVRKATSDPDRVLSGGELKERLTAMLGATDTMIAVVRRIASDLRPAILDVLGVEEALAWQTRQFGERTGIAVHYESSGAGAELNPAQSIAVFRIFQEALTNVLRHAHATRVDVTVVEDPDVFFLMIADNGRGITDSERTGERSIGLLGMRERTHLIGGEIEVNGIEGEGTTVILRLLT